MELRYIAKRKHEKAEALYEKLLKIAESQLGKEHPHLANILENMVKCCEKLGETDKPIILEARLGIFQEIMFFWRDFVAVLRDE